MNDNKSKKVLRGECKSKVAGGRVYERIHERYCGGVYVQ
jgi:hypothetical protein